MEKEKPFQKKNGAGKTGYPHTKEYNWTHPIEHRNQLKMD